MKWLLDQGEYLNISNLPENGKNVARISVKITDELRYAVPRWGSPWPIGASVLITESSNPAVYKPGTSVYVFFDSISYFRNCPTGFSAKIHEAEQQLVVFQRPEQTADWIEATWFQVVEAD